MTAPVTVSELAASLDDESRQALVAAANGASVWCEVDGLRGHSRRLMSVIALRKLGLVDGELLITMLGQQVAGAIHDAVPGLCNRVGTDEH